MAKKNMMIELEEVLLNQIEMLNDDSLNTDKEAAMIAVKKSETISKLADNLITINDQKIRIVQELNKNGNLYPDILGIEVKD